MCGHSAANLLACDSEAEPYEVSLAYWHVFFKALSVEGTGETAQNRDSSSLLQGTFLFYYSGNNAVMLGPPAEHLVALTSSEFQQHLGGSSPINFPVKFSSGTS
jgi:hypothetical protein